ncbi:MAG: helix-turn-helix domain-containing protein [Clostridia bacterium]|nr:helix-turn-helix domain-containing protein [Clostridia bacterium]MBR2972625.1 helix-turn-helix domain-containing protein [Clostridia bacterium]MBR3576233.1 helix-turn-helix domain-containing protein [Clostridia bacterium]
MELVNYTSANTNFVIHHSVDSGSEKNAYPIHNHRYYEIFMLLSEGATFYVEGRSYEMNKGDIILLNNIELHQIQFDKTADFERIVILFTKDYLDAFVKEAPSLLRPFTDKMPGFSNFIPADLAEKEGIAEYIYKMKELVKGKVKNELEIKCFLSLILSGAARAINNQGRDEIPYTDNKLINEVLTYINSNICENLTLENLANRFFVSKYYLSHLFKTCTNFTLNNYVANKKIIYADELIYSGKSAIDACFAVGFNNYSNFYRTYKKILGRTPGDKNKTK